MSTKQTIIADQLLEWTKTTPGTHRYDASRDDDAAAIRNLYVARFAVAAAGLTSAPTRVRVTVSVEG